VQDAPIEFAYKSDIVALITECLIKAIEARTMDTGLVKPKRPVGTKARADLDRYDAENTAYERQAEAIRRKTVQQDVLHGWVLVEYLYNKLGQMEKDNISLKEDIGEMVYGMDVQRELHTALQITFLPNTNRDDVIRAPRQLKGMDLAEMKLLKGDTDGAEDLADSALKANPNDARAHYLAGRIELMHGTPEDALDHFNKTLTLTKDPRTLAWTHIYLGRLYDIARDPKDPEARNAERPKAIAEYKAALAVRDALPDTKAAAEKGLKEPFALPKREQQQPDANTSIDPSGKAEKDAYRPPPPTTTIKPR
jgi:tetratricopeptide (TPR) repeat protein